MNGNSVDPVIQLTFILSARILLPAWVNYTMAMQQINRLFLYLGACHVQYLHQCYSAEELAASHALSHTKANTKIPFRNKQRLNIKLSSEISKGLRCKVGFKDYHAVQKRRSSLIGGVSSAVGFVCIISGALDTDSHKICFYYTIYLNSIKTL